MKKLSEKGLQHCFQQWKTHSNKTQHTNISRKTHNSWITDFRSSVWLFYSHSTYEICLQMTLTTAEWTFASMYALMCLQITFTINHLLYTSHLIGRSPLWMCWCLFSVLWSLNDLLHTSHLNGRSPVCMCWCLFRWFW
jgi:hypothetical protein